jgi:hypothetical protein
MSDRAVRHRRTLIPRSILPPQCQTLGDCEKIILPYFLNGCTMFWENIDEEFHSHFPRLITQKGEKRHLTFEVKI